MNTIWSDNVQGIQTLYLSRKLRFDDVFFCQYRDSFNIDKDAELKILEIGCGPGALAEAMHRWYPNAQITAIDRDSNFVSFGRHNVAGVEFIEGDAEHLPFADNTFDVTISNTVQEHIEPNAFLSEQYRVLKPGGICLCLSTRKELSCIAPCLKITKEEEEFWESVSSEKILEEYGVCQYPMSEAELPASMEQHSFKDVTTNYAIINLTPDKPEYSVTMGERIIKSMRQTNLESIAIASAHSTEYKRAIDAVKSKFDERLRLYSEGIKQWDTSVLVIMIIRGKKR